MQLLPWSLCLHGTYLQLIDYNRHSVLYWSVVNAVSVNRQWLSNTQFSLVGLGMCTKAFSLYSDIARCLPPIPTSCTDSKRDLNSTMTMFRCNGSE